MGLLGGVAPLSFGVVMGRLTNIKPMVALAAPLVRMMPKQAESFYTSGPWRGLIASIKAERGNWCQRCGGGGRIIGDHIVERKDGGADLDRSNVELLCMKCHGAKTARARAARARGQGGGKSS